MDTIENELKELILSKYKSLREFTLKIEMPYSTLDTILKRGVDKANIINILKICNELNISADKLAIGIIEYINTKNNIANNNLSKEETTLLENYNKLNELGKKEANKRVAELTEINRYLNNTTDEISATIDNVTNVDFNSNSADDDEEVFVPYKSLDEIDGCNAAHADDLTEEEKILFDKISLDAINKRELEKFNARKKNK